MLLDGRRPLLGDGVPREEVGTVLKRGAVRRRGAGGARGRRGQPRPGPFGDRAVRGRRPRLGGAGAGERGSPPPAGRRCGCSAPPGAAEGRTRRQRAAGECGAGGAAVRGRLGRADPGRARSRGHPRRDRRGRACCSIGLSERWRKEGLGETRRAIARSAPAPIVFVRRGERPGALAPATEMTRFGWSTATPGRPV